MRSWMKASAVALVMLLAACQGGSPGTTGTKSPAPQTVATAPATRPRPHNFAQWERDVAAFETADKAQMPPKNALVFVGSSTIVRWRTLKQDYPGVSIINRGFGGNEIVDSTHFADRMIFPYQPRAIFLRAGGNDLWAGKTPEQVFADFKDFVTRMRSRLPNVEIYFLSLSPSPARWTQADKEKATNALIEAYIKQGKGMNYIDTYDLPLGPDGKPRAELFVADRLHFSEAGYKLLTERVRPFVEKAIPHPAD